MAYQGIIFDFNGVLWWDTEQQGESWSRYAEILRGEPLSPDEIAAHVVGRDNRNILHYLTGEHFEGKPLAVHTDRKETIYRNLCLEQGERFQLSPGAIELLNTLKAHRIRRTIASSAGIENFLFYFLHLNLARWFDFSKIVYDDDRIATKPAPDPYLRAAAKLGLPPASCVAVEDSGHGIAAARAAGIGYIIALGARESHESLMRIEGVNLVIENLSQIPVDELFP
jgi:beta-phosphoglucomutase-like phosphatase (HAD superfamily)